MNTTSIRTARRNARNFCTKTESNIINMSSPVSLRGLSEAQLKRQIRLSQKYYQKNRENFRKLKAAGKSSRVSEEGRDRIKIRMSLMEDSQRRFEKQLRAFKAKTARKSTARPLTRRSRSSASSRDMSSN